MVRQSHAPTILLTRPLTQSHRFAHELQAVWQGRVVISPLMAVEFLQPVIPNHDFAAIILTSETGAEAARRISAAGVALPKRAFCVGNRTAKAAEAAGFAAQSANGAAADLVAFICGAEVGGPLLLMQGEQTAGEVQNKLVSAGLETVLVTTYRQIAQPLSSEAKALLQSDVRVILPLFSPRSARLVAAEMGRIEATAPVFVAALSQAVALASEEISPLLIEIAAHPESAAMVKAIETLCVALGS